MEILMILLVLIFLGLLGAGVLYFYKGPGEHAGSDKGLKNPREVDETAGLRKKISLAEEKLKNLEYSYEAAQLELAQTKEKEKALVREKSQVTFDTQQYEKFKKEHQDLKVELARKEETCENEISQRRQESAELTQLKNDTAALKKRLSETEDALRRTSMAQETLTKELNLAKKTIDGQKKIVQEHHENKAEGEWVSRVEFNKVERELKEKEALIQKLLAIKKD